MQRIVHKFREQIETWHNKINGYNKLSKLLNVPRDTVGSIIHKFNGTGTAATHAHGQNKKLSGTAARSLKKEGQQQPQAYSQDMKQHFAEGTTNASVHTTHHTFHAKCLNAKTPKCTPLLKPHHKKRHLQYAKTNLSEPQQF